MKIKEWVSGEGIAQRIKGIKGSRGAGNRSVSSKNGFGAAECEWG
jgi:hypothetical protein